jgi:hypothetical protein
MSLEVGTAPPIQLDPTLKFPLLSALLIVAASIVGDIHIAETNAIAAAETAGDAWDDFNASGTFFKEAQT